MIAHEAIRLACRARLLTLEVCTTASTTLEATATGYARASGSFLDDGFAVGMEVTPSGFTQTDVGIIDAVDALTMTIRGGREVEASAGGRALSVDLPTAQGWENVRFTPTADAPYIAETYLPGAMQKRGLGALGFLEATPLYLVQVGVPLDTDTTALYAMADAVIEHFAPTTPLTLASGDQLTVRSDQAPIASGLRTTETHAVTTVTIPLRHITANSR